MVTYDSLFGTKQSPVLYSPSGLLEFGRIRCTVILGYSCWEMIYLTNGLIQHLFAMTLGLSLHLLAGHLNSKF